MFNLKVELLFINLLNYYMLNILRIYMYSISCLISQITMNVLLNACLIQYSIQFNCVTDSAFVKVIKFNGLAINLS